MYIGRVALMFPYLTFLLATVASALPEDESWPAGYPPTPPLLDGATAPDVVNIMFQGAGLLKDTEIVASIIGVNDTATTYKLECKPGQTWTPPPGYGDSSQTCLFDSRETSEIIITQGPSSMIWAFSGTFTGLNAWTEACSFNGTLAKTAICTNSLGFFWGPSTTWQQDDPYHTLTFDGRLGTDLAGSSFIDEGLSLLGPPPFVKVTITAGLEKLTGGSTSTTASTTTSAGGAGAQPTGSSKSGITPAPTLGSSGVVQTGAPTSTSKAEGSPRPLRSGFLVISGFCMVVACFIL